MQDLIETSLEVYFALVEEVRETIEKADSVDAKYAEHARITLQYYSERCHALNTLLQYWHLWDCDILMRAALECATRFLYVSIAPPEERGRRIDEFTISLNEIENLQRSERAKPFAEGSSDQDTRMLVGGAILSQEQETELRAKWPKSKRNILKQKWSFSEMTRILCEFHDKKLDLRPYKSFLHGYGISSHFIHADQTAVDLTWDRYSRPPEEKLLLENAHAARLATSPVMILFICWRAIIYATRIESSNTDITQRVLQLNDQADVFHRNFADSQRHHYQTKPRTDRPNDP